LFHLAGQTLLETRLRLGPVLIQGGAARLQAILVTLLDLITLRTSPLGYRTNRREHHNRAHGHHFVHSHTHCLAYSTASMPALFLAITVPFHAEHKVLAFRPFLHVA
jgi:hypothetical protein